MNRNITYHPCVPGGENGSIASGPYHGAGGTQPTHACLKQRPPPEEQNKSRQRAIYIMSG